MVLVEAIRLSAIGLVLSAEEIAKWSHCEREGSHGRENGNERRMEPRMESRWGFT